MATFNTIANDSAIDATAAALNANGMQTVIVSTGEEAKQKVLELIPAGSQVMTMTSVTLDTIGLTAALNESGKFDASKPKLFALDPATQKKQQKELGMIPTYAVGSVHALTQDGKVLVASNTGSQLPAYIYGADHVIWVVGAQKITKDLNEAMERVNDYVLPLESERAHKAYGVDRSYVSRLLITNREPVPGRTTIVLVKESLGY